MCVWERGEEEEEEEEEGENLKEAVARVQGVTGERGD